MRYVVAVIGSMVLPGIAAAQVGAVSPGARVRVTAPSQNLDKQVGALLAVRSDTLVIEQTSNAMVKGRVVPAVDTLRVTAAELARLEVSAGRRSNVDKGVVKGLWIGGLIGTALGTAVAADGGVAFYCGGADCIAQGAMGGAVWGVLIGLVAGAMTSRDDWRPVQWEPARADPAVTVAARFVGGPAVAVSIAF